ncbi:MAG: tetratricopeptide repeat protein [Isosphaerales bacterium]
MIAASAAGVSGQEPTSKSEPRPLAPRASGDVSKAGSAGAPRPIPDALKFANGLLRQRKYELAAEEYERFLKSGPGRQDGADARFGLANSRLYQGRYQDARRAFDAFLKDVNDDPRGLTARYRIGELSYLLGDLPAARRELEAFTGIKVDHPALETAWTYLGDTCFGLDDLPRARAAYERSLAAYPQGRLANRARYGLARTLAGLGERDRALAILQDLAGKGGPDWVDRAWLQIGLIRKSAGQFALAVDALGALELAAPRSALRPEAQLQRALALVRLDRIGEAETLLRALAGNTSEPLGPRAALELATIEIEHNHPEEALTTLDEAMKRFPKSSAEPALLFRSAEALQKRNRLADAEARFLRVVEADPQDPWADDAMQRAAQLALDRGDSATARRLAGSFAGRFPASPLRAEVRLIDARAAALAGNPKEAVAILESLLDPHVDNPKGKGPAPIPPSPALAQAARYDLALAYRALGQSARALAILAGLAEGSSGPITADAQFLIGQAHLDARRYALAVTPLEQYLAAKPDGDVADFALAQLATARLALGQADDAWITLATLARRFPRSRALAPTRLRLAEAALAAHHAERAVEQFRLVAGGATSKEPAQPSAGKQDAPADPALRIRAWAGLGKALWELAKPAEAASAFAAVLDLAPNDPIAPEIALAHGRALEASQQTAAALKAYSLILERFAKSDQAPQAGLAHARLLEKAGRPADAARSFERLLGDQDARRRLQTAGLPPDTLMAEWGRVLLDSDKPAEADRVFTRLLDEYPRSPFAALARFNLAESANLSHNHAEVVRLLTPLAVKKPPARQTGARAAENKSQATLIPAADPTETDSLQRLLPAVLYRLGRTHAEMKDWNAALETLDRLLVEFPESPYRREALYFRAESALQRGDAAAALTGFTALLNEPPAVNDAKGLIPGVRLKRIQCWVAMKRWKEALEGAKALKAGLTEGDPAIGELNYATGQALLGLARLQEARAAFQSVVDARGGADLVARAQLMCGETYFHQDQFHEALRIFLKVDILYDAPRWQAASLLEAGKVYERLDQWADAAETYERLLTKFPMEPAATEARRRKADASRRAAATHSGSRR